MKTRWLLQVLWLHSSAALVLVLGALVLLPGASAQRLGRRFPARAAGLPQSRSPRGQVAPSDAASIPTVRQVTEDIYEFDYILPTGPGRYHSVGVHRVVRAPNGSPVASRNAVFLAHGDAGNFNADFMQGTHSPNSLAVYLASNGVDVWGIDYAWALVPLTETDFTFMQSWGLQRDIDDLEAATLFARVVRAATGSDGGRLALLGFSQSVWTGYALLDQESQSSCSARQVHAFIPMDNVFSTNDPSIQASACATETLLHQFVAQGFYNDNSGAIYEQMGSLALSDANGVSPFFPPYTNLQALLVLGAAPWQITGPGSFSHFVAGTFGPDGLNSIPTGFEFTDLTRFANVQIASSPWEPIEMEAESEALECGDANPGLDSHVGSIKVPVFYVGAAGGAGYPGLYTLTQLGSRDVQSEIVSFYPPDQVALDYGHFDLLTAPSGQTIVWKKILSWLEDHQEDTSCRE